MIYLSSGPYYLRYDVQHENAKGSNVLQVQRVLPDSYSLQENRIDIWEFSLKNNDHLNLLPQTTGLFLSKPEEERARRFLFPQHQQRFRVAHLTLRAILAHYLKKPIESLEYTHNSHGKPEILSPCSLQFNLSHSGDLALLAIGKENPVGIDLEYFSGRPYHGIAENLYSKKEQAAWHSLPNYLKTLSFFHIWAQKEAFIKAVGMGLSYPTEKFSVPVLPRYETFKLFDTLENKQWQLLGFMPETNCSAAICFHPTVTVLRYIPLTTMHRC